MPIDRNIYFDAVRVSLFGGSMNQGQVDGQNALIDYWEAAWELEPATADRRWLAYVLTTTKWETAHTMQPIEEYGKGSGRPYGAPDPETGQTYYGRGYVQLTWRDNYARATSELELSGGDDLVWHAAGALDPTLAREVIFEGMKAGWFTGKRLDQYFNASNDDPKNARQIVNGNDHDSDIATIHKAFLTAINASWSPPVEPVLPPGVETEDVTVQVVIRVPAGTRVEVLGATVVES